MQSKVQNWLSSVGLKLVQIEQQQKVTYRNQI